MERACAVAALVLVVAAFGGIVEGQVTNKCELRDLLKDRLKEEKHAFERLACYISTTSQTINSDNSNSEDGELYGFFQISQHFCSSEKSLCGGNCEGQDSYEN
ncbi:hypothetical protein WMY93_007017 [Mugilogobius chulae]|uniref:Uncharacterized protein n=1 Tax=Mugilogobius chulae TaxID=88201 RepID=A0AAW0PLX2_9GOBI